MNIRSLFVCGALVLFESIAYAAGSYQRTRDGQTLVWRDLPERGEEATWSGKRDKDGFATGSGVLTWYKVEPSIVTGSNILDTRRYMILINHYSGTMVRGKFKGLSLPSKGMEKDRRKPLSTKLIAQAVAKRQPGRRPKTKSDPNGRRDSYAIFTSNHH